MRFLITARIEDEGIQQLSQFGEVIQPQRGAGLFLLGGKKLIEALSGVDVFITEVDPLNDKVLEETPDLKCVVSCRGDPVNVDVAACTRRGIPVIHAPGRNADAVADLAVCLMIMLARKIPAAMALLREKTKPALLALKMARMFTELRGSELCEKTVGLVGLGAVGRAVAARLRPFGCRVVACDPYLDATVADGLGVRLVPLEELLASSDFVSLHTAVTEETRGMIGADQFARMKRGAFFINTARAALTDEDALAEALRSGHLSGAALDVFAKEPPPPDHPLLQLPNVIALPHIGGNTHEVPLHQTRIVVADVLRWLRGERPLHLANPEVWQ